MRHRYSKRSGLQIIRKRRQIFPQWTSYSPTGPDPGKLFCSDHNVVGMKQGLEWKRGELKENEEEEEDEKEERVLRCARKKVGGLKGLR